VRARLALVAAVLCGLLLAHFATRTPAPVPASAPERVFSADRAMDDVRAIARAPHPTGSSENARSRDYLVARLRSLGLQTSVQQVDATAFAGDRPRRDGAGLNGPVENVMGILPGRDRRLPAILLMSHYDSVPDSPGAADDAVGVAAGLETVRALLADGRRPLRDVVLLFTDAEEVGLNGARAFWGGPGPAHPLAARIGVVLNAESRGGGGRTLMFETSPAAGGLVRAYAGAAKAPAGNSLAAFVYERLPNDTDFTVAKRAGVAGLNFAFLGRPEQYHQPSSTPEALDQGSLQHTGDQLLAFTRELAETQSLPAAEADLVYSDVLGLALVTYPAWGGWLVLAVTLALVAWAWRRPPPWREILVGFGGAFALLLGTGAVFFGVAQGLAGLPYYRALGALRGIELGLFALAVLISGAAAYLLTRGRSPSASGCWLGFVLLGLLLTAAAQALAPATAFLLAWPVLIAALAAALAGPDVERPQAQLVLALGGALALGQVGAWAHYFTLGLGYFRPEPLALLLLLAVIPLTPLLLQAVRPRA
jgi:hypothetical protein